MQALVLLSGGLDSVFNLYASHQEWPGRVQALFFNYGQKAAKQESQAAQWFADQLKVPLTDYDITSLFLGGPSALIQVEKSLPTDEVNIENLEACQKSAQAVWVPNRNGILINIAAGLAESQNIPFVIAGFNKEEAQTFPDNSPEFIQAINGSLSLSTANNVRLKCFSQDMNKSEMYARCISLGVDMNRIWSCYQDGAEPCGVCESCQRFLRASESFKNKK